VSALLLEHEVEDEAPTWEPIRVPTDATATKWCVNRNWNRRGPYKSKATK
jgi:hypothetical protein